MPNTQIGLLPLLYVNGLIISNNATTPNTKLDISAGQARCGIENSPNLVDVILESGVTIDTAVIGANGIDTGALAASTWYYPYLIGSSTNQVAAAAILSTSATAPAMPEGYDVFKKLGFALTDGSVHFLKFNVAGNGNLRQHFWDDSIKVANDLTSATLAAIDLSTAVPPVQNTPVYFQDEFTPATAGDYVSYVAGDSTATVGARTYGSVAAKANGGQHKLISRLASSVAKIKYINSAASCNLDGWVNGFEYFV